MAELSVVVPFCNEWPQLVFTLRNIAEELQDLVDFEVLAVDNCIGDCDKGLSHIKGMAQGNSWLKVLEYKKKLSHWNAKNLAVEHSTGQFLWFCDSHCYISRGSLVKMFEFYRKNYEELNGSIHLPLTYHILEWRKLIYRLRSKLKYNYIDYVFAPYQEAVEPYEVPCMSSCGMMLTRKIYDEVGGWPTELGAYSGGEHFINFVLGTLGMKKWIMPGGALYHHGDERGYESDWLDQVRNRAIAMFMVTDEEFTKGYVEAQMQQVPMKQQLYSIYFQVIQNCREHQRILEKKRKVSIFDWLEKWEVSTNGKHSKSSRN